MLLTLSGSGQTNPVQFLNWQNGVSYNLVTQAPQYSIQSLQDLQNVPISGATSEPAADPGRRGGDLTGARGMAVISHYNTRRVVDIYGSVQDRDLGAVGRDITRIVDANRAESPARQLRDPARPGRDHAHRPMSASSAASPSPSFSSIF